MGPLIPILVAVVVVVGAAAYYFYFAEPVGPGVVTMTGLQIAESSLSFLAAAFHPDGRMVEVGWLCESNRTFNGCQSFGATQHHSGWYGSAYAFVAEKTGSQNHMRMAEHIFTGRILHPDGAGTLEECLTEDPGLISHLVEQGGNYHDPDLECVGSFMGFEEWRQVSGNQTFLEGMRKGADWMVETGEPSSSFFFRYLDTGKLARMHAITGEAKYLAEAERRLVVDSEVLKGEDVLYLAADGEPFHDYACWIAWGESELYRATGDARYLQSLESFAQRFDISNANAEPHSPSLDSVSFCVTVLMNLFEDTREQAYRDQASALMQRIVEKNWDPQAAPKYNGDNGFLGETFSGAVNSKTPLFTAYMIRELAGRFADQTFVVSGGR